MAFRDIDALIRARTPEATNVLRAGTQRALQLTDRGAMEAEALRPFAGLEAFQEQQALLGLSGDEAQRQALSGIPMSAAMEEQQRRQREMLGRQAYATGDVSGASLQRAQQLGAAQELSNVQGRLSELEPLAALARSTRSDLSRIAEAAGLRRAELQSGLGTQLANVRLGAAAPQVSSITQRAELSGLQGIARAQQQANMQNQLAGLAGQFAPQIGSYFQGQQQGNMIAGQTGYTGGASGVQSGAEFANF